jgi:hypothetical protein
MKSVSDIMLNKIVQRLRDLIAGKASVDHNHDDAYSASGHSHTAADVGAAPAAHSHDGTYAPANHLHEGVYSSVGHNHEGVYAESGHTHTALDVGAVSWTLLWSLSDENVTINKDGAEEFAAQTISINLGGYDGVKIIRNNREAIELYRKPDGTFSWSAGGAIDWINNNQFGIVARTYQVSDTGIEFEDCHQFNYIDDGTHSTKTLNTALIPLRIYGIKLPNEIPTKEEE